MRRMLPVVQIVGVLGCSTPPTPTPEPVVIATNPPPTDVITAVPLDTIGTLNARSSLHGRVYTLGMGRCGVDLPRLPDAPVSSGINLNIGEVVCPEEMLDPAFQACAESILVRQSPEECVCEPVTGNPPPPPRPVACPG
jgi:hypothetical protein